MEKISFIINILIILLTGASTFYAWRLWKLTCYKGMFWLAIANLYMLFLRVMVINDFNVTALVGGFWIPYTYALYRLYKQSDDIIK
jgi:hypothetical protein